MNTKQTDNEKLIESLRDDAEAVNKFASRLNESGAEVVSVPLLADTIQSFSESFDRDLFVTPKEQLEGYWHFAFDAKKSVEANIYNFHDMLKLYGNFCRRWEQHHNGSCCVVERVRDHYLWPKIKLFADDLRAMLTANDSNERRR